MCVCVWGVHVFIFHSMKIIAKKSKKKLFLIYRALILYAKDVLACVQLVSMLIFKKQFQQMTVHISLAKLTYQKGIYMNSFLCLVQ